MGSNCSSVKNIIPNSKSPTIKHEEKLSHKGTKEERDELAFNNANFVTQSIKNPFEKYTIVKFLGEGSYGKVHLVRTNETGIERAMKEITKKASNQTEKEIINEIEILKQLDHPYIVKIYEFFVTDDKYY